MVRRPFRPTNDRGTPHAAHQAHVIRVTDDRIISHVVYCGGRWPASLLAEMAEAEAAGAAAETVLVEAFCG